MPRQRNRRNANGVITSILMAFVSFVIMLPVGMFAMDIVEGPKKGEKSLEDLIRAAEERELETPSSILVDPYDGSCLGRNQLDDLQKEASEIDDEEPSEPIEYEYCSSAQKN